ncbi:MAG: Tat pathway signal sequence domain protein, partial [Pseudomonadota bacterium]
MSQSRRHFLRNAWAMAAAAPAYATLSACTTTGASQAASASHALVPDTDAFLDLPPGFTYQR